MNSKTIGASYYQLIITTIILWIASTSINAQIIRDTTLIKRLPRISGWADNEHYIVKEYDSDTKKDVAFIKNIKTGKESPYEITSKERRTKIEIKGGNTHLTDNAKQLALVSPNNKWVAFLHNNNLFAVEMETGREVQFTYDGSETIMNGYASWVYYEEILGRGSAYRAFWWSPDSKHIAFYKFDDSNVPIYPLHNSETQHGFTEMTRYPKAGDPNPVVSVGIASIEKENVVWSDFDQSNEPYLGTPFWRPDASGLLVQWMSREQNNLKLFDINPQTGIENEIYDEKQPTWINWIKKLTWLDKDFLMIRDFDGWEQIYYYAADGKLKQKLTTGKNWRTEIIRVDKKTSTVFYSSNAETSTRTDLYSVRLDGKKQKRISFGEFSHSNPLLSPNAKHVISTYSNVQTPSSIALIDTKTGKVSKIANSRGSRLSDDMLKENEIIWHTTEEGLNLPARITWPRDMQEDEKYPVTIHIYGGSNYQAVFDVWTDPTSIDNKQKSIQVKFAHRGSGDAGKEGLNYLHRNLGKWEMHDYIEWVKILQQIPQVDHDRIMISGGSYGGYLTAMALTYGAEYFKYGISSYPVTDWMLYDSHYTERYMDHPKDNPEGYKFGSVMTHIDNYQMHGPSMLQLQHGTMDDNVHIQNTYQLADALQKANKPFEMMIFPGQRHGWVGAKSRFTINIRNIFYDKYLYNNTDNQ